MDTYICIADLRLKERNLAACVAVSIACAALHVQISVLRADPDP